MIHAYDEDYLADAMANLAGAFDYALNDCGLRPQLFADFFAASATAALFERGVPKAVSGMSGEELVLETMVGSGWMRVADMPPSTFKPSATPEYWCGWVLAYCQWRMNLRFSDMFAVMPVDDVLASYPMLHEADEERFVDMMADRLARDGADGPSRLASMRRRAGMSQSELSARSGVSLRSVQMYEQRRKDIGRAAVTTVASLARVLGCRLEDLLERPAVA